MTLHPQEIQKVRTIRSSPGRDPFVRIEAIVPRLVRLKIFMEEGGWEQLVG